MTSSGIKKLVELQRSKSPQSRLFFSKKHFSGPESSFARYHIGPQLFPGPPPRRWRLCRPVYRRYHLGIPDSGDMLNLSGDSDTQVEIQFYGNTVKSRTRASGSQCSSSERGGTSNLASDKSGEFLHQGKVHPLSRFLALRRRWPLPQ